MLGQGKAEVSRSNPGQENAVLLQILEGSGSTYAGPLDSAEGQYPDAEFKELSVGDESFLLVASRETTISKSWIVLAVARQDEDLVVITTSSPDGNLDQLVVATGELLELTLDRI